MSTDGPLYDASQPYGPTFGAAAVAFCYGIQPQGCLVHPSAYSQGQCALLFFGGAMNVQAYLEMGEMARSRYRAESRELAHLFHVTSKVQA